MLSGQERKKRQAPPIQVSPDDVILIQPLRVVNDQLLVSFVVGGQEGQSAPVSGADVASLLQAEGPSLAMTLSNLVRPCYTVHTAYMQQHGVCPCHSVLGKCHYSMVKHLLLQRINVTVSVQMHTIYILGKLSMTCRSRNVIYYAYSQN